VVCVFAGQVHAAASLTKVDCQALNAFGSADPVAWGQALENLDALQKRFAQQETPAVALPPKALAQVATWPWVELVFNHAAQDGAVVNALLESKTPPQGWVVAGTGNGTMSQGLEAALIMAQLGGARVWRTSRCAQGQVQAHDGEVFQTTSGLNPYKARVVLALTLVAEQFSSTVL
jgi:L-asparaginase